MLQFLLRAEKLLRAAEGAKKSSEWNYTFLRYRVTRLQIGSDSLAGPTGRICQWCETCKWFSSVPATSWPSGRLLSGLEVSQNFLGIFHCQIFIVVIVDLKKRVLKSIAYLAYQIFLVFALSICVLMKCNFGAKGFCIEKSEYVTKRIYFGYCHKSGCSLSFAVQYRVFAFSQKVFTFSNSNLDFAISNWLWHFR